MAETITVTVTDADETITVTIDEAARGPAGPAGGVESYVDEIETLPDYPSSFPTTPADISNVGHDKLLGRHGAGTGTAQEIGIDGGLELQGGNLRRAAITGPVTVAAGGSVSAIADGALTIAMTSGLQTALDGKAASVHTHVSADITDSVSLGSSDYVGKLLKVGAGGTLTMTTTSGSAFNGNSNSGSGVLGTAVTGNGGAFYAQDPSGKHILFGKDGNPQAYFDYDCNLKWIRGAYTGGIVPTGTLTANRTYTLPDESGTIALTSGLDLKANLAGTNTFTGANIFSSTTRPTSAGTGTPAATSLMTRDDVTRDEFLGLGISFKNLATPSFATSGTGTSALAVAGDRWVSLASGTSNSGWARASIGRGLTTNSAASGSGINFAKRIGVAVVGFVNRSAFTDQLNIFRIVVGSNQTPTASGSDPVTYRSFGLEMRASGTAHEIRAFGHNGTSITYSSWVDTGLTADLLSLRSRFAVESDGAGNITAAIIHNHSTRAEVTATCTGGPTTAGALAQSYVDIQVANSSSGTTSLSAAFYDHLFYVI